MSISNLKSFHNTLTERPTFCCCVWWQKLEDDLLQWIDDMMGQTTVNKATNCVAILFQFGIAELHEEKITYHPSFPIRRVLNREVLCVLKAAQ